MFSTFKINQSSIADFTDAFDSMHEMYYNRNIYIAFTNTQSHDTRFVLFKCA